MNTNEQISFFCINDKNEKSDFHTTRKQLVKSIDDIDKRDLYILDRNFNFKTSTITKKGKLLLIKIDYFRCFIIDNTVYIAINSKIVDRHLSNFSRDLEIKITDPENVQKFKWDVLEQIFIDVAESFRKEIEAIVPKISLISNDLFTDEEHVITNREFIDLNIDLLKLRARVKDVFELFEELIPRSDREFDQEDVEDLPSIRNVFIDLIETYIMRFEEYYRDIKNMLEILETATEINATQLDEKRNRMQLISVYLDVITLGVTIGALLTGMFGMNLKNGWENSYPAFVVVCMIIFVIFCVSLFCVKYVSTRLKI